MTCNFNDIIDVADHPLIVATGWNWLHSLQMNLRALNLFDLSCFLIEFRKSPVPRLLVGSSSFDDASMVLVQAHQDTRLVEKHLQHEIC